MILPTDQRTQDAPAGYLRLVARRKFLIALPIGVAVAFAYLVASTMPPQYAAEAMLALDTRKVQVIQIDSVVSRLPQEDGVLRTELDALSSRSMAARVAQRLDLVHDPEFLREIYAPQSSWQRLTGILKGRMDEARDAGDEAKILGELQAPRFYWQRVTEMLMRASAHVQPTDDATAEETEAAGATPPLEVIAVNWLLGGLRVSNDGRSFTIRVSFVSHSAELSTRVANAFADAYLNDQVELQVTATQNATAWLSQRLEGMRLELEASESAVQSFRRKANLLEVSGTTTAAQQLSQLNAQLVGARNTRLQLETRLQSIREVAQNGHNGLSLSDVVTSPNIDALRMRLGEAIADARLLQDDLGPRHPLRLTAESKVDLLKRQLADETEHARRSLQSEVAAARSEEEQLQTLLRTEEDEHGAGDASIVRLNQLEREFEANRALYESLLNRYKQTLEQEGLATPEARLLSRAVPPGAPSGPRKMPILLLGLFVGSGIGAAFAAALEWRDRSIRRISEIEQMTGVPVFGVVPGVGRMRALPADLVLDRPRAPFSEALRRALVAFQLSHDRADVKVIMVTSATAREGKTAFCVAAARALALTGVRVLVIDADLHRPRIAASFGGQASAHIGDVIRGRVTLDDAVAKDLRSTARFLAALPDSGNSRVLEEAGFATLMDRARERYDVVIVDTPPLLARTDAAAVGALADANLFLVRWGRTPRTVVLAALRFLGLCRIAVDGIVMTHVNLRRLARYDDLCETVPYRSATYDRVSSAPLEALPPPKYASSSERQHTSEFGPADFGRRRHNNW